MVSDTVVSDIVVGATKLKIRRAAAWLATAGLLVGGPAAGISSALSPIPASATTPPSSISLQGHGWGHGRGMGQWGALGYALAGQTYSWILGHYYGGTTMSTVPNADIRVRLVENDGNDIIVTSPSTFTVAGHTLPGGQAARMHLTTTADRWEIDTAPGCAGPWNPVGQAADTGSGPLAAAQPSSTDPQAPASALLQLCLPGGNLTVRGAIGAAQVSGVARTVNILPLDSYVRGVVASESPAYWGTLGPAGAQGEAQGFQALETQAVAARSYALADQRSNGGRGEYGYADVCDTTSCQVYRAVAGESTTANRAVDDTAGQVRLASGGGVALTEFSSSTGGWTAGGQFPAVVDDGDSVCVSSACNSNHTWTASVSTSTIQSSYPAVGTLQSVTVTARSGPSQADQGGRASQVSITGSAGSVTITGDTFAAHFGLKSDWFAVQDAGASGGTTATPTTTTTTAPTTTTTAPVRLPTVKLARVAGTGRDETAVAASRTAFPMPRSARAVILTRDDQYADALAGAPLAAAKGGPLLLTPSQALGSDVLTEINRVLPPGATVYVLGGQSAIGPAIDAALARAGFKVSRIEGATRYATAVAIAQDLGNPQTVFEVTGTDFPDGLAAGPAAITRGAAIVLTAGSAPAAETAAYLLYHPTDRRFAIGGPAGRADPKAVVLAGADRYATSVAVAQRFFAKPALVGIATGADFPDALAAGPALGHSSPLLLVPAGGGVPPSVGSYLTSLGTALGSLEVFGGTSAVDTTTVTALTRLASLR